MSQSPLINSKNSILRAVVIITATLTFFVGCSTNAPRTAHLTPEQHCAAATRTLALSRTTTVPSQVLEYRLQATEHFIKAGRGDDAGKILRDIPVENVVNHVQLRNRILETRLALLKNDHSRALQLVKAMLGGISENNSSLAKNNSLAGNGAKKIALLLPSRGPHAEAAKTIRDGFMASYYSHLQQNNSDSSVKVYDTADGTQVEAAFHQAMADNVDLVVGPLTKAEVQAVANLSPSVPVLALNSINNAHGKANKGGSGNSTGNNSPLYQFGLMPEDEVVAVAAHARSQGHKRALVIAPQNEWGKRMSQTFNTVWNAQGGQVVHTVILNPKQEISAKIQAALKSGMTHQNDFDMVFLAASPELGRQVKTLVNHHNAANLPVYATAAVYSGTPIPAKDHDLDGVKFCDMPWVLDSNQDIRENRRAVAKMWPNASARSPRHFALGMDAYRMAQKINDTQMLPFSGASGATGDLRLEGQRIQRRLTCAKFENGVPVPD